SIDYSLEHPIKAALEQEGGGRGGHPVTTTLRPQRGGFWGMAHNFCQKLSDHIHLWTDCNLDGLPFHAARNGQRHLHSFSRRDLELETQLIDDLLDFTRITKDKLQLRFAPVDAHVAISDVVEMCRAEAESRKLQVHLNLRANTHYVAADAAKFQQIIWNLLKNATKFTPEDGEIAISSSNPSPEVLAITVRDTGIGM